MTDPPMTRWMSPPVSAAACDALRRPTAAAPRPETRASVRELRTDWAAFLDQDDEWLPEKLERQCGALSCVPEGGVLLHLGAHVYEDEKSRGDFVPDPARIARGFRYRNCFGSRRVPT